MAGIYLYGDNQDMYLQALSLAKALGEVAGEPVRALALGAQNPAFNYGGVDELVVLESDDPVAENYAEAIANVLSDADALAFIATSTSSGRDVAAQVAALHKTPLASEALKAEYEEGALRIARMMYGGAVVSDERLPRGAAITLGAGKYDACVDGEPSAISFQPVDTTRALTQISFEPATRDGVDIAAAERVVGVGRGVSIEQDFAMAKELAAAFGAELGCTRSIAEEFKWLPNENYIGISGITVAPDIYLALGISGQVQHVAGIRGAKLIVAVDKNEKAPIFQSADYGIVGDVTEIMPALMRAL